MIAAVLTGAGVVVREALVPALVSGIVGVAVAVARDGRELISLGLLGPDELALAAGVERAEPGGLEGGSDEGPAVVVAAEGR